MNPNLDLLTDLFNVMFAANNSTVNEDSESDKFSQKVNEFLTTDGFDKWSDWVDFDGLFKLVAENFNPNKGINRIPIEIAIVKGNETVAVVGTYVINYSQVHYAVTTIDGGIWSSNDDGGIWSSSDNGRFRVGIPAEKTVRDVPFDTVIKSVQLVDGTTCSNVTRVKGGVLSIVDGEITIHDLDDIKDFDL